MTPFDYFYEFGSQLLGLGVSLGFTGAMQLYIDLFTAVLGLGVAFLVSRVIIKLFMIFS